MNKNEFNKILSSFNQIIKGNSEEEILKQIAFIQQVEPSLTFEEITEVVEIHGLSINQIVNVYNSLKEKFNK
ncbi:MAG: hypothetical protein ACOCP8_05865 [archaeon]